MTLDVTGEFDTSNIDESVQDKEVVKDVVGFENGNKSTKRHQDENGKSEEVKIRSKERQAELEKDHRKYLEECLKRERENKEKN